MIVLYNTILNFSSYTHSDGTVDDDGEASLSMDEKMSETESISSSNAASLNLTRHRSGGAADKRGVEQRPAGAENSTLPEPTPSGFHVMPSEA